MAERHQIHGERQLINSNIAVFFFNVFVFFQKTVPLPFILKDVKKDEPK